MFPDVDEIRFRATKERKEGKRLEGKNEWRRRRRREDVATSCCPKKKAQKAGQVFDFGTVAWNAFFLRRNLINEISMNSHLRVCR
jgi:hypothetical protein